ncbi:L-asparaginase II [Mycetocola sp. CAN_C7]|uniref:asparaginase n=1 Tax=Mycetocola sp. CAN_C7 TaxID=2787724 RepID=UPI0018C98728
MTTAPALVETFPAASAVELAIVTRSGFVESRHVGSAIVLDQHADIIRSLGDPNAPVFPRSTLKPFQAIAVMNAGVGLRGAAAVLATASHSGTQRHVSVVRSILAQAGLTEIALQCPADWPTDQTARDELLRDNGTPSPIYMNCSGKHAAMLLACVTNGWPIETYLENDHPMQVLVKDVVERFTGERPSHTGIDGCGAPVHALSLASLARGIGRIRTSSPTSPFAIYRNAGLLCAAVLENGWALDGPGRANTIVIDRLGVFAKLGAEGVMVMAAADGTTVALKMLDGSLRAATVVGLQLLVDAGALEREAVDAVLPDLKLSIAGGDRTVGEIRVSPLLEQA